MHCLDYAHVVLQLPPIRSRPVHLIEVQSDQKNNWPFELSDMDTPSTYRIHVIVQELHPCVFHYRIMLVAWIDNGHNSYTIAREDMQTVFIWVRYGKIQHSSSVFNNTPYSLNGCCISLYRTKNEQPLYFFTRSHHAWHNYHRLQFIL